MYSLSSRGKQAIVLAAASSLALALAGCTDSGDGGAGGDGSLADMEPVTLTWAEAGSNVGPGFLGGNAFMDYVTEQTDGKITFETYYNGALFPVTETLAQVGSGVSDGGFMANTWSPEDLPVSNFLNRIGGSQNDPSFPLGWLQGIVAAQDFTVNNELIQEEYHENNVQLLSAWGSLNYNLLCTSQVSTLDQVQGKLVRVGGAVWGAEVEALGAAQTFVQPAELYEALQRDVIDCVSLQAQTYADLSLWEVAKHYTPVALSTYPGTVRIINLERWNSFPDEVKQIFQDAVAYEQGVLIGAMLDAVNRFITEGQAEYDMQIHDATELNEAVAAFQAQRNEESRSEAIADGVTGGDIIDEYEAVMEKWRAHFEELGLASGDPSLTVASEVEGLADEPEGTWGDPVRDAFLEITAGRWN